MKKIIFLDIDGPMIPGRAFMLPENYKKRATRFDPIAVALLNKILENGDIELVISSVWRLFGYEKICETLKNNGIDTAFLHEDWDTDRIYEGASSNRVAEIKKWLKEHPEVKSYVVIDDKDLKIDNFVQVSYQDGLLWCHYLKVCEIFGLPELPLLGGQRLQKSR